MSKNENLHAAKVAKNDEFYTQYDDIEKEMNAYIEYNHDIFRDKTVLCPCDDPEWSNFTKYFVANFERLGLRKLISTSYAQGAANKQISLFEKDSENFDAEKHETHGRIFVLNREDLKVSNLVKNRRLAKAISDSGWRMFLDELKWCASKRGKTCILINPRNTTQTCSACGYVCSGDTRITLGVEEWDCPHCGTHHIRDYNAAVNIKENGLALLCSPK